MKDIAKEKKKLNPSLDEKINVLKGKMDLLKRKAKADEVKRLNGKRIKLHDLVTSFVSKGWPEDYESLKLNITSIMEE
jgi:hypothetical protein